MRASRFQFLFNLFSAAAIVLSGLLSPTLASGSRSIPSAALTGAPKQAAAPAANYTVSLTDAGFSPQTITVTVGAQVIWTNHTSIAQVLQSGLPQGGHSVYLPLIGKQNSTSQSDYHSELNAPLNDGVSWSLQSQEYFKAPLAASGSYTHTFTTSGQTPYYLAGKTDVRGEVVVLDAPLPPDPGTVAPAPIPGVATDIYSATAFLYSGSNPIQTGVAPGVIQGDEVTVLRGKVVQSDGSALAGVRVTVKDHPEFGQTFSRADGLFDLALNGGKLYTLSYTRSGYLSVQRKLEPNYREFKQMPDVALIPLDTRTTAINLSSPNMQVAQGNPVSDQDGTRQGTLLIPPGTQAELVFPDGSKQSLSSFHVRISEYTAGAQGPQAMPGELPPTSGYTYAVEYSLDEAIQAGAVNVNFNQPLIHYSQNFLNFSVGQVVPTGYYDRILAAWVPGDNGRVVKIINEDGGLANLDTDGDGVVDNGNVITSTMKLAISTAERQSLAQVFPAGQALWRVPIQHFTPWDCNWAYGPPTDAVKPSLPSPRDPELKSPDEPKQCGSIIGCETQSLGEQVPLVGTPFNLAYNSRRTPPDAYTLNIKLVGSSYPSSLQSVDLTIDIFNNHYQQSFTPQSNLSTTFTWDGKDAYGRTLLGEQMATVRVGYIYRAVYYYVGYYGRAFGQSGKNVTPNQARMDITFWQTVYQGPIGALDPRLQGLGGWTLSANHVYNPISQALYMGDGTQRSARAMLYDVMYTAYTDTDEDHPAFFDKIINAPNGSFYVLDMWNNQVKRLDPDGKMTVIAGIQTGGYSGDGGPAIDAALSWPDDIALAPDGSLYIADSINHVIRKITPDGIMHTAVGNHTDDGNFEDGMLATQAPIYETESVAVAPDGTLYVSALGEIYRVTTDGLIYQIAGGGGSTADDIPAIQADLYEPTGLVVGPDGNLYLDDDSRVRRISEDGLITTIAGGLTSGFSGDGGAATSALFSSVFGLSFGPDNSLYITDRGNSRIRRVTPDGIVNTVAGGDSNTAACDNCSDGSPATLALLVDPCNAILSPDGNLYITDRLHGKIRKVVSSLPGFGMGINLIGSTDGQQVYVFNSEGQHLQTLDALTGGLVYAFGYDNQGRLAWVKDGSGNQTTIERDAAGKPTAIASPYGQRTLLTTNTDGWLTSVTDPAGEIVQLSYGANGLLKTFTDANHGQHSFGYNSLGRLLSDTDPLGNAQTLTRLTSSDGYTVTLTSPLSHTNDYAVHRLASGDLLTINIDSDKLRTQTLYQVTGGEVITHANGTIETFTYSPDPRWGMSSRFISNYTRQTPGGLVLTYSDSRQATLDSSGNPFGLVGITDTLSINNNTSTWMYTGADRLITTTSPQGRQTTTALDSLGRVVTQQTASLEPFHYTYDSRGRLAAIKQGTGSDARTTSLAYDGQGNLKSLTNPLSQVTRFVYDLDGRVISSTLASGAVDAFTYDANSNLLSLTSPGKTVHTLSYTPLNQLGSYTPPGSGSQSSSYTYNPDRMPQVITQAGGQTIVLGYDSAGRLNAVKLQRGSLQVTYNPLSGNIASLTAPGGIKQSLSYDGDLLTAAAWSGPVAGSVHYAYNNDLLVQDLTGPDGVDTGYWYDMDDLPNAVGSDMYLNYDSENGLLSNLQVGSINKQRSYNAFGELSQVYAQGPMGDLYNVLYQRDKLGRFAVITETVETTTSVFAYSYDDIGRLTGVTKDGANTASYTYDANGNRVGYTGACGARVGSYDAQDRLTQYGSTVYTYTPSGELSTRVSSGKTITYTFDALGNLLASKLADGRLVTYLIDAQNQVAGKKINGTLVQGFLYSGSQLIAELDSSGHVLSSFIYASSSSHPDYMMRGGTEYRIIADPQGSPLLVVDANSGAIVQKMAYDAFGNVLLDTNPGFQPLGFAGGLYDRDTRLVRFGARSYDPETGRWTSKDPILFGGGQANLYEYVFDDPVNFRDPSGLDEGDGIDNIDVFTTPGSDVVDVYTSGSTNVMPVLPQDIQDAVDRGDVQVQVHVPDSRSWLDKLTDSLGLKQEQSKCPEVGGYPQGIKAFETIGPEVTNTPHNVPIELVNGLTMVTVMPPFYLLSAILGK
jgi:RHS repeat-associated protein